MQRAQCRLRGIEQEKLGQAEGLHLGLVKGDRGTAQQLRPRYPLKGTEQGPAFDARAQVQQHSARLQGGDGALQLHSAHGVFKHFDRDATAAQQPGIKPEAGVEGVFTVFGQQHGRAVQ